MSERGAGRVIPGVAGKHGVLLEGPHGSPSTEWLASERRRWRNYRLAAAEVADGSPIVVAGATHLAESILRCDGDAELMAELAPLIGRDPVDVAGCVAWAEAAIAFAHGQRPAAVA